MPIVAAALKAKMQQRILNELKSNFAASGSSSSNADKDWEGLAKAIAAIADDICEMLLTQVAVQDSLGGPGKLL